jgi:hypothetical protein
MEYAVELPCLWQGCYVMVISRLLLRSILPSFHSALSHLLPSEMLAHKTAAEVRGAISQKTATCLVNSRKSSDPAYNKFRPVLKPNQSPLRKSGNGVLYTVIVVT